MIWITKSIWFVRVDVFCAVLLSVPVRICQTFQSAVPFRIINWIEEILLVDMAAHGTKAYIEILEQPAKLIRFRYDSENRPTSCINSSRKPLIPRLSPNPTIRIVGYSGKLKVLISCVSHVPPYRQVSQPNYNYAMRLIYIHIFVLRRRANLLNHQEFCNG